MVVTTKSFTNILNRGKLVYIFHMTVCLAKDVCCVYQHISRAKAKQYALFSCTNLRDAVKKVAASLVEEEAQLVAVQALFNAFTSFTIQGQNTRQANSTLCELCTQRFSRSSSILPITVIELQWMIFREGNLIFLFHHWSYMN